MCPEERTKRYFNKFRDIINKFQQEELHIIAARQKSADETAAMTNKIITGGTVLVVVLSLLISYLLALRITGPLVEAVGLAESISKGDLTRSLPVKSNDEVGRLSKALNEMVDNLRTYTQRLVQGVNVLSSSAAEVSSTASQLSVSTSKTSSAMTETTTTVEQVKQAAKLAGDKAKKVAEATASRHKSPRRESKPQTTQFIA